MSTRLFDIGIQEIAKYLPDTKVDNIEQGKLYNVNERFVLDKIGCRNLPRMPQSESVSSACQKAYANLLKKAQLNQNKIDCIVVCTQSPDLGGIPHTSSLIQAAIGAPEECACFDIGLGCSGYVYSLQIVSSFMQMHGLKKGLLFTCDPYSKILDHTDKGTSLLFGDAATITLLSEHPQFTCDIARFSTRGSSAEALTKKNGKFFMNGRAVFDFALTEVPKQILSTIAASEIKKSDIDLFLLHQGSKFMLENIIKRINEIENRTPISIEDTGNTVSSSIPILLEEYIHHKHIDKILLSGFGVGLSWATAIYSRK